MQRMRFTRFVRLNGPGVALAILCALGSQHAWARDDDLALHLDFDQRTPFREENWGDGNQHWRFRDNSHHDHYFLLSVRPNTLSIVPGVHGRAVRVSGDAVSNWRPLEDDRVPTTALSILMWVRLQGDRSTILFGAWSSDTRTVVMAEVSIPAGENVVDFRSHWFEMYGEEERAAFSLLAGDTPPDTWVHFAATYDRVQGRALLYVDGEELDRAESTIPIRQEE